MATVISEFAADITRDAANYPVSGMLQKFLMIPGSELDPPTNVTQSTESLVTDIVPDAAGHVVDGIGDNTTMDFIEEGVENVKGRNGYTLGIVGISVLDPSTEVREIVKDAFVGGGHCYVVLQRKWGGTSREDAFLFGGYTHGLVVKNLKWAGLENDGAMSFDLMTPDERTEPFGWMNYLKTNYTTTETDVWTNKLA